MSVAEWIPNLALRLAQLDSISGLDNLNNIEVWLGGLFFPEAYITATRQAVAHRKKWSLETLQMQLDIERVNDPEAFILDGKQNPFVLTKKNIGEQFLQALFWRVHLGRRINWS